MGDGATYAAFSAARSRTTETHPPISAESLGAVKVDFEHGGSQGLKIFLYTKYTRVDVTKNSQANRLTSPPPGGTIIATGNESLAISQEYKIINNNPVRKRYCYV